MDVIRYRAIADDGRSASGTIQAASVADATRQLAGRGLVVVSAAIEARTRQAAAHAARLSADERLSLVQEWATLLSAGLTVDDALAISESAGRSRAVTSVLAALRRRIRDGAAFHLALAEARLLPDDATMLIQAGERAGALAKVLETLAADLRARRTGQDGMVTALLYPAALLVTTLVAIGVIVTVVAPNLAELFAGNGAMPPRITALLAFASITSYALPAFVAVLAGLGAVFVLAGRSERGRLARDRFLIRVPFLGEVLRSRDCARFATSGALMIGCGMTPSTALPLAVAGISNRALRTALDVAVTRAAQGTPLHEALSRAGVLPPDLLALIAAGLRAGRLGEVLGHGGAIHAERARSRVQRFSTLLTPAITVFAGLVIGGLAYVVMTAVLSLNEIAFQ